MSRLPFLLLVSMHTVPPSWNSLVTRKRMGEKQRASLSDKRGPLKVASLDMGRLINSFTIRISVVVLFTVYHNF